MRQELNKGTQILLALTCIIGSAPAPFMFLGAKLNPIPGTVTISFIMMGLSLLLGCLMIISLAVEHGRVNRRDVLALFIAGFLGIIGGALWFIFWTHTAPESTGHYFVTLNTIAIATLVFSVCAAIVVVIRGRKLYRHVLVYLTPFCLISVQWMIYNAWWERSGLWY